MSGGKTDIWVYADWLGMPVAKTIGVLSAHHGKGRKSFSFAYDPDWIKSEEQFLLDPDIAWYTGPQFPVGKENFGIFLDSMPDTWGRTLMKRRSAQEDKEEKRPSRKLHDIDFLLGVFDESRMGALRFKLDPKGPFLDDNARFPAPPWSSIRELQHAASKVESDASNDAVKQWLGILMAPGSSLGGARPKANLRDQDGNLWIAKFPSKNDNLNKAAWEYLAYKLAIDAGIEMAESKIEKISGKYHTFFTKRFDREGNERIHFASAMTMTGNNEDTIRDSPSSYLEIAEFIQFEGDNIESDLHQLWRRIVFNILISNTDDHLRNHGFIIQNGGWRLSPAYDINPSVEKFGLALNIDMDDNALDLELVKSVGEYFQLDEPGMDTIISEVRKSVSNWRKKAIEIGIPRSEREIMEPAFRLA